MGYEFTASHSPDSKALERFFCGFAEYIFHSRLGIADTELVTYISDLLIRFTKMESMHRIRHLNGRPATEVVGMMAEAEQRIGIAKREVHRHIGDFALFWTGLYPESLRELQGPDRRDQFVSYCHQGKRAYEIASAIEPDSEVLAPSALLKRLSEQFEMCAYGLREVRRQWESPDDDKSPGTILL
ncbi:MAG: hypothetical protein SGI77_19280 [Pirellulaceae bacterium]|nr:hypothetical protein [Pirellulaceae bacterium]